jgi:hypothetical protein
MPNPFRRRPSIVPSRELLQHLPRQIHETIKALVGFVTRNTSSSMETDLPPGQGVMRQVAP